MIIENFFCCFKAERALISMRLKFIKNKHSLKNYTIAKRIELE